jgi:hypothetical protein
MNRIEDWLLRFLQRRCKHPDKMVALDILEGTAMNSSHVSPIGIEVAYCNRCGAVRPDFVNAPTVRQFPKLQPTWRLPDPNLWRG